MSDLRERIAEIAESYFQALEAEGYRPEGCFAETIADKIIAELGLRQESKQLEDGYGGMTTNYATGEVTRHSKPCTVVTRYVTEWRAE